MRTSTSRTPTVPHTRSRDGSMSSTTSDVEGVTRRRRFLLPIGVASLAAVIGAAGFLYFGSTAKAQSSAPTTVPIWSGLPITAETVTTVMNGNPTLFIVDREPSTSVPAGVIYQESPAPGTPMTTSTVVTLTVSSGFPAGYAPPSIPSRP
ncbi:PASTA domain-containing protein [Arthrobacter sp. 2MCAF14]|uniref:PASTA domain-containing protein n=1 Tax=Arthrobacter sp. 2MCAF14 TaxID=3232982 RepID=UPI003F91C7BE